jgi:hypothetical protein
VSRPSFNGTISDEREVLAVCLDHLYLGDGQVARSLTRSGLHRPTEARTISYVRDNFEGLDEETLADFLAKNRERYPVEPDLNPGGRFTCVDDREFEHIFRDGEGWERFRQAFPESDGTLRFSRVGLNPEVTQAMLYAGQQFDRHIGSGGYWLFSKSDGTWTEAGRLGTWIS